MTPLFARRVWLVAVAMLALAKTLPGATLPPEPAVTHLQELHRLTAGQQRITRPLQLIVVVCWVSPDRDLAVIRDESSATRLELDPQSLPVQPGDILLLEGSSTTLADESGITLGQTQVVNSRGLPDDPEPAGEFFLNPGRHLIRVTWLDPEGTNTFNLDWQPPGGARQPIPPSVLFHQGPNPGPGLGLVPGLSWRSYRAEAWLIPDYAFLTTTIPPQKLNDITWRQVPDLRRFPRVSEGIASDFHLSQSQPKRFSACSFKGWIEVPQAGKFVFFPTPAGACQIYVGLPRISVLGHTNKPSPERLSLGQILSPDQECQWAVVEGIVESVQEKMPGYRLDLSTDTGHLRVELNEADRFNNPGWTGSRMRLTGMTESGLTTEHHRLPGSLWVPDPAHMEFLSTTNTAKETPSEGSTAELPLLPRIESVNCLKFEDALRGYPVKIEGIVTWAKPKAVILQEGNAAIYMNAVDLDDDHHGRVGERWSVEGRTAWLGFSPIVEAQRVTRLGRGLFPEPIHPSWGQLINGSLDAKYVEIQGRVSGVLSNEFTFLLRDGKLKVALPELAPEKIRDQEGALIRLRGCLFPVKDENTHVFKIGEIALRAATLIVEEPAPADPFDAPAKRVAELLQYDARAATLKPIKIVGQIIYHQADLYFLMDGKNGLRFVLQKPTPLEVGDQAEVVGYLDLSGPSPELPEALARKIGTRPLPPPQVLSGEALAAENPNGTWVQTEGLVLSSDTDRGAQLLKLQAGARVFEVRLPAIASANLDFPIGSRLQAKGVLWGLAGDRSMNQSGNSFTLLVNRPEDVVLLAQPAGSNLRQLFMVASGLGGCTLVLLLWNWSLRQQVAKRGAQLRVEISERENAEKLRSIEAERARIARDLHDDLGSSLTEISFLADAGPGSPATLERAVTRFQSIARKSRALVTALDVIVWLINPKKDNLIFLASYLGTYAEEYLAASEIACHLNIPAGFPELKLSSQLRHNLFMAVKEVLHNIIRHAHASQVRIDFLWREGTLEIIFVDNGRGFDPSAPVEGNGVENMKARLTSIGGECHFVSQAGVGTTVHFQLPLQSNPGPE